MPLRWRIALILAAVALGVGAFAAFASYAPIDFVVDSRTVTVRDRGRGIPADDLERIFDRFYRAVDVRTEPGSGLGLSIVEAIVRSHGGTVFARNRDGGGAEVGFTRAH